jgi:hypothetical protein
MADFVFNIAKGRVVELFNRVDTNDPTNSALIVVPILLAGIEADATLQDYDTLSALLAAANDEATGSGWNRKTLTDSDITMPAPDDTNNRYDLDIADQTWTAVSAGTTSKLLICYDNDTTGGTDANIIPLTAHDFAVTPDGSDVVAQIAAAGFFRAS